MAKKSITVTLVKSPIRCTQKVRATIRGLGLRKLHSSRTLPNTPEVRGMVKKVITMLEIQES